VMCQGRASTLAVPLVQLSLCMLTLVTAPIRALGAFTMVLEWKEPSRVTWHLTVTSGLTNSSLDQVVLMFWVLLENVLADAVLSALASSRAAMSAVSPSFAVMRIKYLSCSGASHLWSWCATVVSRAGGVARADHHGAKAADGLICGCWCANPPFRADERVSPVMGHRAGRARHPPTRPLSAGRPA
jgi:hypothetical protein